MIVMSIDLGGMMVRTFQSSTIVNIISEYYEECVKSLPDVQAAEDGEDESYDEGQRDAQQRGEHLVDEVFTDLIHGRAADPHFIKAVSGIRLCYHILKGQLQYKGTHSRLTAALLKGQSPSHCLSARYRSLFCREDKAVTSGLLPLLVHHRPQP